MLTEPPIIRSRVDGWLLRNWKWLVTVISLVIVGCFGIFLFAVFGLMRSSDAYVGAVARAKGNASVTDALGVPISDGYWCSGSINVSGSSGRADFAIPVSGPKGKATIYVNATKSLGMWHYDGLIVEVASSGSRIDLADHRK